MEPAARRVDFECPTCSQRARMRPAYAQLVVEVPLGHDSTAHRAYSALMHDGIDSIDQLRGLSDDDLLEVPHLGDEILQRIRKVVPGVQPAERRTHRRTLQTIEAARNCPTCTYRARVGSAYAQLITEVPLGHDVTAHRGYSALLHDGIESIERLSGLSDEELLEVPRLNSEILRRIRAVVAGPSPRALPARSGSTPSSVEAADGCTTCTVRAYPGSGYAQLITEVPLGHDVTAHRGYSALLHDGIESIEQLRGLSDGEIRKIPRLGATLLERIRAVVQADTEPWLSPDVRILRHGAARVVEELAGRHYALGVAIASVMRVAADEVEHCDAVNALKADHEPTVLASTASQMIAAAAQIYFRDSPRLGEDGKSPSSGQRQDGHHAATSADS